jgi:hypothetical protein
LPLRSKKKTTLKPAQTRTFMRPMLLLKRMLLTAAIAQRRIGSKTTTMTKTAKRTVRPAAVAHLRGGTMRITELRKVTRTQTTTMIPGRAALSKRGGTGTTVSPFQAMARRGAVGLGENLRGLFLTRLLNALRACFSSTA